jgi:hypothetical protein
MIELYHLTPRLQRHGSIALVAWLMNKPGGLLGDGLPVPTEIEQPDELQEVLGVDNASFETVLDTLAAQGYWRDERWLIIEVHGMSSNAKPDEKPIDVAEAKLRSLGFHLNRADGI